MERLPVIDMRGFAGGDFERITTEIAKACRTVGFFYVVDHGVAPDLMRAAFAESRAFFAEPVATKAALAIERVGGNRGYSGLKHEALNAAGPLIAMPVAAAPAHDQPDPRLPRDPARRAETG